MASEHRGDVSRKDDLGVILWLVVNDPPGIAYAPECSCVVADAVKDLKRDTEVVVDGFGVDGADVELL